MDIPLCIVCGTTAHTHRLDGNFSCPVCRDPTAVEVVRTDERCCVCWIPLCKVNTGPPYARCGRCGSRMPAAVATTAPSSGRGGGDNGGGATGGK